MIVWAVAAAVAVLVAPSRAPEPRVPAPRSCPAPEPPGAVVVLGRWLRGRLRLPPDAAADRWWGWTAVASAAASTVSPALAAALPLVVASAAVLRRRAAERRRAEQRDLALPEVLELIAVAIRAGGTVPAAVVLVAERGPAAAAPTFRSVLARAAAGLPLPVALEQVPRLLGETYRPLAAALISAEAHGAPLISVVAQLSEDAHDARRRAGEIRARQVPVRLLLPLVCCTLPAVLVVTIVPLVAVGGGLPG